jgi:hypothetical protein
MAAKDYETQELLAELSTRDLLSEALKRLDQIKDYRLICMIAAWLRGE